MNNQDGIYPNDLVEIVLGLLPTRVWQGLKYGGYLELVLNF